MADTIVQGRGGDAPDSAKGTGSLRLKVLGSPLAAVEAALDGGIGVRCAERPTTFDGRSAELNQTDEPPGLWSRSTAGGTPSEPIVSRDATKSASRKVNELREQPTARQRRTPNRLSRTVRCKRHARRPYQSFQCAARGPARKGLADDQEIVLRSCWNTPSSPAAVLRRCSHDADTPPPASGAESSCTGPPVAEPKRRTQPW